MIKKKGFLWLILITAVVVIAGSTIAQWLSKTPEKAEIVPQNAIATLSLTTDSSQWQQLQQYGTSASKAAFSEQLQQWKTTLTANGYTYQQDFQPWVGNTVTVAFLPSEGASAVEGAFFSQNPVAIAFPVVNLNQARLLIDKTKAIKVGKFIERTYQRIAVLDVQGVERLPAPRQRRSPIESYSIALLDRYLVITTTPTAMNRLLDTYQGKLAIGASPPRFAIASGGGVPIASVPGYNEAWKKLTAANPFARLYLNLPQISALTQTQQKGIAATLELKADGLHLQGISWLKPESKIAYKTESTPTLSQRLPANALLALSGGNLQQMWQDYQGGSDQPKAGGFANRRANLRDGIKFFTGWDLEQDLLSWTGNEFSVSLLPAPQNTSSILGAGVAFLVQASNRFRAEKFFEQLDQFLTTRYQFQVQKTQLNRQPVVNLSSPLGGLNVTRGWLDKNIAFLTVGAPIAQTLLPQPKATIEDSSLFQQTVPTEPQPNSGQFFLDLNRILKANIPLPQLTPTQKIWVEGIEAIGMTSGVSDPRTRRFDLIVRLKK